MSYIFQLFYYWISNLFICVFPLHLLCYWIMLIAFLWVFCSSFRRIIVFMEKEIGHCIACWLLLESYLRIQFILFYFIFRICLKNVENYKSYFHHFMYIFLKIWDMVKTRLHYIIVSEDNFFPSNQASPYLDRFTKFILPKISLWEKFNKSILC